MKDDVRQNKHRFAFETLRREILLGKFDAREKFPSEGQLMRRFGMSRVTIRQALADLKHEGILESRAGSGTFLAASARNATGYLGLILPGYGYNEIFAPICSAVSAVVAAEGYSLLFGNMMTDDPGRAAAQTLALARDYAERHVAGVMMEPVEFLRDSDRATREILECFARKNIPVVFIDRDCVRPPARSPHDLVGIDNVQSACRLADYLISRGARRIVYFVRPGSASTTGLRAQGVAAAVTSAGLPWGKTSVVTARPDDLKTVGAMIARRGRPDAVVCANDFTAAELMKTLARLGVRIPDDIMVAGFDDVRIASLVTPRLTTMRQPCGAIAELAVQTLLQRIRRPSMPTRTIVVDAELVVRESTR